MHNGRGEKKEEILFLPSQSVGLFVSLLFELLLLLLLLLL